MNIIQIPKAILVFEDGSVYHGKAAGITGTTGGEVCFNTGMTGYQEIFTDTSYYGQILLTTNVHIGNYGIKDSDTESEKIQISGLICRNFTKEYNRPMANQDIQTYFEENNMVCIYDVDTRSIVRKVRDKGVMNCIISSEIFDVEELKKRLKQIPSMEGLELASRVTTKEAYYVGDEDSATRIAVMDFGTKRNILRSLAERGAYLKVFPAKSTMEELSSFKADGYFLSNGPGDPASMEYAVTLVKDILKLQKPVFGICLGHQLLALASGLHTYKMYNGHRGANHPVKNLFTGHCEITSQNHGFGVRMEDVLKEKDTIELTHINLNDDSVEGIRLKNAPAFSVQYHPEANPGPHDSKYLFDDFIKLIKQTKNN
ncbi:MAG: glutamine-hydrolyzing carbamoyl-phosphate synthase small subunit [Saprospiraceae bacterium]|nr:glutamine-hydrolyzing carbamoyl-phosphate synthase small subunit [Saprospiraceae bacterium]